MNHKFFYAIIAAMWCFVTALLIGSIVTLSLPVNYVPPPHGIIDATHHNGWWLWSEYGIGYIIMHFNSSSFSWWYTPNTSSKPFLTTTVSGTMLLIAVVPILSIIFALITWRLIHFMHYPKSIEYIDAIKLRKKTTKKTRRLLKKITKNFKNQQITEQDKNKEILVQNKILKTAQNNYQQLHTTYLKFKQDKKHELQEHVWWKRFPRLKK